MGLRPARVDRKTTKRSFTRTALRVHKKNFIKGVPGVKIRMYNMGNKQFTGDTVATLVPKQDVQVRHNALEAGRVAANAYLKKTVPAEDYFLKVHVFPHQILREHAQAAVAQADRFYQGMAHPFGRPKGRDLPGLSLRPIAFRLTELLGRDVKFSKKIITHPIIFKVQAQL